GRAAVIASYVAAALALAAAVVGMLRWLRVAQREHYLPGSVTRFALRWARESAVNTAIAVVGVLGAVGLWWLGGGASALLAVLVAALVAAFPVGLSVKGRTKRLAWTRRVRVLAAVTAALFLAIAALLALLPGPNLAAVVTAALLVPVIVDLALRLTLPFERRAGRRFVDEAARRLRSVSPRVVAITGSYGKTSTKQYVRHLLGTTMSVLASPASFNNMAGLSRTINEHLVPGTQVFVAEVGTYGPGEIREICSWLKPEVGVMASIGPVHLERMGSLENIAKAKSEILENASVGVLNIDAPHLAKVADEFSSRLAVMRCSVADVRADVSAQTGDGRLVVRRAGEVIADVADPGAYPSNVAVAVAVALHFGVPVAEIARLLPSLPVPEHRQAVGRTQGGVTVIDDTYNANPAGARGALELLRRHGKDGGRRVVVTPGMVELGTLQERENAEFASLAAQAATDVVVVGRTNRNALLAGAASGSARVHEFRRLPDAVAWVRENLGDGDAVLYENDLPDHYP
ncbi:MAG: UDP-N-acetylmuramoyl-tripeptide--D-alanyl-D-alanine ligase, partial [Actinomycetota bacterium]|nr:UDP-N-acetylmuramoyl-tripeptide--D-alanyl-D-alanine ligase [Actinomycetota bacterium]